MAKRLRFAVQLVWCVVSIFGLIILFALPTIVKTAPLLNHEEPFCHPGERCAERKPMNFVITLPWGSATEEISHDVAASYGPDDVSTHDHTGRNGAINDYYAIDFALSTTDDVRAVASGYIKWADWYPTTSSWTCFGRSISIAHDGVGQDYTSFYAHLSSLSVASGQYVRQGDIIGKAGNTGSGSSWTDPAGNQHHCLTFNAHLHWALYHQAATPTNSPPYSGQAVVPEPFRGVTDYVHIQRGQALRSARVGGSPVALGDIGGLVRVSGTGATVSGANVKFEGGGVTRSTTTNSSGAYLFSNVPAGVAKMTASKADIGKGSVNTTVLANASTQAPDISLIPFCTADMQEPSHTVDMSAAINSACVPSPALDLAFAIDTTGSMWDDIAAVKVEATNILNNIKIQNPDSRIAVMDFRDFPSRTGNPIDYPYRDVQPFTSDANKAKQAIDNLNLGYGGDGPETRNCALMHAIKNDRCAGRGSDTTLGPWRTIKSKSIIILTDAPALSPEPFTGFRNEDVVREANKGGIVVSETSSDQYEAGTADLSDLDTTGIRFYPIIIGTDSTALADAKLLADGTGGKVFTAATATEVVDAILDAIDEITAPPLVFLPIVAGNNAQPSDPPTPTPSPSPSPTPTPSPSPSPIPMSIIRIDTASTTSYTDSVGNTWLADTGFVGGNTIDRGPIEIANTNDDRIYQTERYGMSSYSFAVPNGYYVVKLHFAETIFNSAGRRVFSVNVHDAAINYLDVYKEAGGKNIALVKSLLVNVTNGQLSIQFTPHTENPEINGIEVIPSSALRIETGSTTNYTNSTGNLWHADVNFDNGNSVDRGPIEIANTDDDRIYQTERWSVSKYRIPVTNGGYSVKLHFAETNPNFTRTGIRVFHVNVEGQQLNNLDVFAEAGGQYKPLIKLFDVHVIDGEMTITFTPLVQNPEINGIEIIPDP